MKLLRKEFSLCMHPTCWLMPLLSVLILTPGYPYGVCCFYVALSIFFVCLTARENHDAAYTLTLAVMGGVDYGITVGLITVGTGRIFAKVIASVLGFFGNYLLRRYFVFFLRSKNQ